MNRDLGPAPLARCLLVWLAATSAVVALAVVVVPEVRAARVDRFDLLLVTACHAALLVVACWLWLVVTVVARDAARGARTTRRGVPAAISRALLLACGAALAGGLTTPSYADSGLPSADGRGDASVLQGLPLPERASAATAVALLVAEHAHRAHAAVESAPSPATPRRRVVVAAGDTLWALAAATLPANASNADIAAEVQRLHAANRATVGADPDLIVPGQVLRLPPPIAEPTS